MSSRYRNVRYDDAPPYNGSARAPRSPRSPKSSRLSGRRGRTSSARWEPKSPRKEDEKKGEFNHEEVEAELSIFKKGVFYFDETLKPTANGHAAKASPSKAEHSRFQLKLSDKLPPSLSPKKSRPLSNGISKLSSKASSLEPSDDSKDNSTTKAESSKLTEKKRRKKAVVVTQQPSRRRVPRVQPIVTISPQRMSRPYGPSPYGAFVPPRSDYYYASGYYGGANAAPSYYDLYRPNAAGYLPPGPPNGAGGDVLQPEYSYLAGASGSMGEDGLWYPFPEAQAQGTSGAFSTPKKQRKSANGAEVDLTSPSKAEQEMSPGRRVNKIQKQLEYYFSPENVNQDGFLRDAMDAEGWVDIDVLMDFKRMKQLKATKELVIEAAFHSTVIEIDHVKQDKVRMTAQWRAYVEANTTEAERKRSERRKKKRSQTREEREREKLLQRELDSAEVTESTIDAIVALVEKKQERRAKRRELREREKAKKAKQEKAKEEAKAETTTTTKDEKDEKEEDADAKTTKSEATAELIKQDQAKNDADADSKGDPDNNDMVEID